MAKRPRFSRNARDIACAARTGKTPTKIEAPPPVRPRGGSGLGGARFASRPRGPAVTPVARRPARGTKARAFRADIAVGRGGVLPQGRFRGVRHRDPGSRNSATATRHPTCPQKAASATPGVHLVRRPGDTPWDRCLLALRWSHVVFGHLPARGCRSGCVPAPRPRGGACGAGAPGRHRRPVSNADGSASHATGRP